MWSNYQFPAPHSTHSSFWELLAYNTISGVPQNKITFSSYLFWSPILHNLWRCAYSLNNCLNIQSINLHLTVQHTSQVLVVLPSSCTSPVRSHFLYHCVPSVAEGFVKFKVLVVPTKIFFYFERYSPTFNIHKQRLFKWSTCVCSKQTIIYILLIPVF